MMTPIWIVAFSGHRPAVAPGRTPQALAACRPLIQEALVRLQDCARAGGGTIELLTGVAAGADQVAADAAMDLRIPVHVILPLPVDSFARDFNGVDDPDWRRAQALIDAARAGTAGATFRIASGESERPACYHEANGQMFEVADVLLAVWNGDPSSALGGTDEALQEATRRDIPTVVIDPVRAMIVVEDALNGEWAREEAMVRQLDSDLGQSGVAPARRSEDRRGPGAAWALFARLDDAAVDAGSHFRTRLVRSLSLHFAAALLAAANAVFSPVLYNWADHHEGSQVASLAHMLPMVATLVEFVLVSIALFLMGQTMRRHSHRLWRRMRFAAELMHGFIMTAGLLDPLRPMVVQHDREWKRFAIMAGLLAARSSPPVDFQSRLGGYLDGRIEDQMRHFDRQRRLASRWNNSLTLVSKAATILAPAAIGFALVAKVIFGERVMTTGWLAFCAVLLPIALPLIAGAASSLVVSLDASRRAERYQRMHERLAHLRTVAQGVKTLGGLQRVAADTELLLLHERVEWYGASKNIGH